MESKPTKTEAVVPVVPVKRGPGRPRKETIQDAPPKPKRSRQRSGNPVGRPRLALTEQAIKQIEQLAQVGCIHEEIAAIVGVSSDILASRYSDAIAKGKLKFKGSLRMLQFKLAKNGSASMAIFLGKNYLDQSDKIESKEEISGPGGAPLSVVLEGVNKIYGQTEE